MLPFLTSYDPLGGSSGSIDPLGALQTYGALADMLLPGVTTITTRSRYLSMLCAALANAERHQRFLPGASGLAQRRKAVEPFERLWALACVAARDQGVEAAADGLRGITYAEKTYRYFKDNAKPITTDFKLLKYQSRTGAVGTYWTALVGGQLVDGDTGTLAVEGRELAEKFPVPRLNQKRDFELLGEPTRAHRVALAIDDLLEWAELAHLGAAERNERQQLSEALTADDRRECVSQALVRMANNVGLPATWDAKAMHQLRDTLNTIPRAVELRLHTVVDGILSTERFHEALLCVFETLLWWGTKQSDQSVQALCGESNFRQSTERCRECALQLRQFRDACDVTAIRSSIEALAGFTYALDRATTSREVVEEILRRHHHVQSGKVDGGMAKRDWISCDGGKLLRPSPRFQQTERTPAVNGSSLTHPYRLEQFIHMLRENEVLPAE